MHCCSRRASIQFATVKTKTLVGLDLVGRQRNGGQRGAGSMAAPWVSRGWAVGLNWRKGEGGSARWWLVEDSMAKGWRFGMLMGSGAWLGAVALGRDRENP